MKILKAVCWILKNLAGPLFKLIQRRTAGLRPPTVKLCQCKCPDIVKTSTEYKFGEYYFGKCGNFLPMQDPDYIGSDY